jgi:hypothetical protein
MGPGKGVEMRSRGNVVHTVGAYKVYEVVETYMNNKTEVIGYHVYGPGADSTWLYTIENAIRAANELGAKPTSKPKPF